MPGKDATLPLWQPSTWERVREAWQSRRLLPGLARSSVPTHSGQLLGRTWLVLRPFMQVFGFALIFGGVFRVRTPNGIPYIVFMLLGIQAFRLFETTLIYATISTRLVKAVTRPLRFPLLLIPLGASGYALLRLAIDWLFAACVLLYYVVSEGHLYLHVGPELIVGVLATFLCLAYGLAVGLTTSVIYPRARDMRYGVRYAGQMLLLFTPVLYPLSALPEGYRTVAQLNPLAGAVGMVQWGLVGAPRPGVWAMCWAVAGLVPTTLFGVWFFNRYATRWIGVYQRRDAGDDDADGEEDVAF